MHTGTTVMLHCLTVGSVHEQIFVVSEDDGVAVVDEMGLIHAKFMHHVSEYERRQHYLTRMELRCITHHVSALPESPHGPGPP
jgi:hypothetical protein